MGKTKGKDQAKKAEQRAEKAQKQMKKAEKKGDKKTKKVDKDGNIELDELDQLLSDFKKEDKKKTTVNETSVNQPGQRSSASIISSTVADELWLFGGEHNKGMKTWVYNDLFVYKIKTNKWVQLFIPNPPSPRCSHQAVATPMNGGQMWVFGGEFSSPSGAKFHHFKDMWMVNFKEKESWEQVPDKMMKNGPSARSGHRMAFCDKKLWVFGGFNQRSTEFIYYNDMYSFSLDSFQWTKILAENLNFAPSPRSACQMLSLPTGLSIFGGYCKKKGKKADTETGNLSWDGNFYNIKTNTWQPVKQGGQTPVARSSFTGHAFQVKDKTRAVFFGGVLDEDDGDDDDLDSEFLNDLHIIDCTSADRFRWFPATMRGVEEYEPCPRMSSISCLRDGVMYLFGGLFEDGDAQFTLNDFWSLDLKRMNGWKLVNESEDFGMEWDGSSSEESSEEESDEIMSEDEKPVEIEKSKPKTKKVKKKKQDVKKWKQGKSQVTIYDDHPTPIEDEDFGFYWERSEEYWFKLMSAASFDVFSSEKDSEVLAESVVREASKDMAKHFFKSKQ